MATPGNPRTAKAGSAALYPEATRGEASCAPKEAEDPKAVVLLALALRFAPSLARILLETDGGCGVAPVTDIRRNQKEAPRRCAAQ